MLNILLLLGLFAGLSIVIWGAVERWHKLRQEHYAKETGLLHRKASGPILLFLLLLAIGSWFKSQERHFTDRTIEPLLPKKTEDEAKSSDATHFLMFLALIFLVLSFLSSREDTSIETSDNQVASNLTEHFLFFLPQKEREILIGDLEEEYWEKCEKLGRRKATNWYWRQVGTSCWPLLIEASRQFVMRSIRRWIS